MHFSDDSSDFGSPQVGGATLTNARGENSTFTPPSLEMDSGRLKEVNLAVSGNFDLRSTSNYRAEESYGFIDTSHRILPSQTRSAGFELQPKHSLESRPAWVVSPVASNPTFWDMSGKHLQETQTKKHSGNIVHDFQDRSRIAIVRPPQLFELEDNSKKTYVSLNDMQKELQNTLHQLKVLHAFPPGSNFEDEHSELVRAILAMTKELASLKCSSDRNDSIKAQTINQLSASDFRDLVSQIFDSEIAISDLHFAHDPLQHSTSSLFLCNRSNLITSIRECLSKTRSDWSAQYKQLEEKFLKSRQDVKATRHEAADAIQKATAQFKDADLVWETSHSQHLITIGNLREQLHNITVRYSNLQVESKSEQENQEKEYRQQISYLQGQISALKQVSENQTFLNSEETRRYEALSVEHDKVLQTLSNLTRRDEQNEVLHSENSKLQLILLQKQADHDSLASKYSNLQNHFNEQQTSFQQLVSNSSSSTNEEVIELRGKNSELLAQQQHIQDALVASLRTGSTLENENNALKQCLDAKSLEISAKDDEIRQHELFQLACTESQSTKLQECTFILQEARTLYHRTFPGLLQDSQHGHSRTLEHVDLCDLIRAEVAIILDRQMNLEKIVQKLRQRIKILKTQAKVASSNALKDTEDRIYEVESIMDHSVDALLRQQVLAAVDGAKSQLRDFNIAHEHHYVMGMQDINDHLHTELMEMIIRDRSLRARISAIFEFSEMSSSVPHANR